MRQTKRDYLDGSYGRLPIKALRVAALLGSLENKNVMELRHWHRGQQIAERWREGLHRLMGQVQNEPELSREAKAEQRILDVLNQRGTLTVRNIHRWTKLPYAAITERLESLATAGVVNAKTTDRTTRYTMMSEEE